MTTTVKDSMITPSTTNDMARPKIQIDTPVTGQALQELARHDSDITGLRPREYWLLTIYFGARNDSIKNIARQELGSNFDNLLKRFELL